MKKPNLYHLSHSHLKLYRKILLMFKDFGQETNLYEPHTSFMLMHPGVFLKITQIVYE